MRKILMPGFLLLSIPGCFMSPIASKGKVMVLDATPRIAAATEVAEGKAVSQFDPNSKTDTAIVGPSGALAGSKITLPAGSLAIATELIVEEAVSLSETSLVSSLAIDPAVAVKPVGAGLIIRPSENVDLTKPLTIAMPINPTGLRGWLQPIYYTVLYKYFVDGELRAGVIPTSALKLTDDGLVYFEGYFGAYWLAEVSAPIETKVEIKSEEPIVNKDKVSVIESTGIVSETKVSERAQVPLVVWETMNLTLDSGTRTLLAKASISAGRELSGCNLDLFKDSAASSGQVVQTGSSISWTITPDRAESYTLQARYRCQDDQGRLTISPWSALVTVPALVIPAVQWDEVSLSYSTSTERATLTGRIAATRKVNSCKAELLDKGQTSSQSVSALSAEWIVADSSTHDVQARFICLDDLGRETTSPWSATVSVPVAPIVQWTSVTLAADNQTRSAQLNAQIASGRSLVNCLADFAVSSTASPFFSTGVASLSYTYAVPAAATNLVGRFRCSDDRGRSTVSPWSSSQYFPAATLAPVLTSVADKTLPSSQILAGTSLSLDFDNTNASPPSDSGMSYQCEVKKLASSDSALLSCATLSGDFAFDTTTGELSWTPDYLAVGAYQFQVTGTNAQASATSLFKVHVMADIDYSNRLFHLDARFADGQRGGQNSATTATVWKNLLNQTAISMTNFVSTATWTGSNEESSPTALSFPGSTALASFPAPYPAAQGEIHFDTLVYEGVNASEKVILSSGSSNGHGFTLTNRSFFVGVSPASFTGNYPAEVGADGPALYWRFDSLANSTVSDSSGNGRNGSVMGSVTLTTDALGDGSSQAVLNSDNNSRYELQTAFDPGPNWTIETWFKLPLDNNCNDGWCSLVRGSNPAYHWVMVQKDSMLLGVYDSSFRSSGYSLNQLASGWHHLAAVGTGGSTQFFIDGSAVATVAGTQATGTIQSIAGEGNFSWGEIDEFAIYSQALSATRIQDHALVGGIPLKCALALTPNSWNHIAATVSDSTNTFQVQLNGANACVVNKPASVVFAGSAEPVRMGASALGNSTGWDGAVSSLVFYNDASLANAITNFNALSVVSAVPLSGLVSWFRSDRGLYQDAAKTIQAVSDNDPVFTWTDFGPGVSDMMPSVNSNQQTSRPLLKLNGLNGKPVLSFDGSDDHLLNYYAYEMPNTIFIVARYAGTGPHQRVLSSPNRNWLMGWWGGGLNCSHFEAWINSCQTGDLNWRIYASTQTSTAQEMYAFTSLIGSAGGGFSGPLGLTVGGWRHDAEKSSSEVAELIVYNRVLSAAERVQVMNYLNARYAIYAN